MSYDKAVLAKRNDRILELSQTGAVTLKQIGKLYGIGRERVRQILEKMGAKSAFKPPLRKCDACGGDIYKSRGRQTKFCSHGCFKAAGYASRKKPESSGSRYHARHLTCEHCGKEFVRVGHANYMHDLKDFEHDYCSQKCYLDKIAVRVTALGETKTLKEWSRDRRCRPSYLQLRARLKNGWEPERAISEPIHKKKQRRRTVA